MTGGDVLLGFVGVPPAAATEPVFAEAAGELLPPELLAISCTRIVWPTSLATSL